MKKLGMTAQIHSRHDPGLLMHKAHGERAWDMPPFRRVEDRLTAARVVLRPR
jgi:hypothetical protein